jgi:hypothetical protein
LNKGIDLEAKDISGKTALIFAACFGHAECLELLIKAGADLSAKDHEGKTALACARNFIRNFPKEKSGPIVKGMLEAEFERRALARSVRAKASLKKSKPRATSVKALAWRRGRCKIAAWTTKKR